MSLKPQEIGPVPEETTRVARAAYPKGNVFMRMRDELGPIYQDEAFAHLFSHTGQPAEAPWRLALVTVMQFARSAFPIVRPQMRCAVASIGSMH
jgi:transposase